MMELLPLGERLKFQKLIYDKTAPEEEEKKEEEMKKVEK